MLDLAFVSGVSVPLANSVCLGWRGRGSSWKVIQVLRPMLVEPDQKSGKVHPDVIAGRDNAASALAKIIMVAADKVPLQQVVELMLSGLPLRNDFEEAKFVYPCITQLFRTSTPMVGQCC